MDSLDTMIEVRGVEHHTFGGTTLTLDTRYFPVAIAIWGGRMTHETIPRGLELVGRVTEHARQRRTAFVFISDTTQLSLKTNAEARRLMGEYIDDINERDPGLFLDLVVIVRNRVMRAFMAMLLWALKRKFRIGTTGSMESALVRARAAIEAAGGRVPEGLDPTRYERPVPPEPELVLDDASGL